MGKLPEYESELAAAHRAFFPELSRAVADLEIPPTSRVLDLACGDGFFTRLLSEAMQEKGTVFGIDQLPAYVEKATLETHGLKNVEIREGDAYSLDIDDHSIDLVWCAQSLMTLDQDGKVLGEVKRILAPLGRLAVLEQDQTHELILPWPPGLEFALQQALWRESQQSQRKGFVARTLRATLKKAGFSLIHRTSATADRASPLDSHGREFLKSCLERIASRVRGYLSPADWREFHELVDPHNSDSFLNRDDPELTYLFWVWIAQPG